MFDTLINAPAEFWQLAPVRGMVFFLGCCWGSFLNVCVYRIPAELSVVHPGSHCFHCKKAVAPYDNVPLLSWLILGGKCRHCKSRISPQYFFIELLTGLLFLAVYIIFGFTWLTPVYWLMIFGLMLGSFVDLAEFWIPDRVTWGGIIIGIPLSALVPELHGQETWLGGLQWSAIGAASGFFLLWGVGALGTFIFKKDAMGFGDVKLLGAIGAFLGWQAILLTIFAASVFGSIVGVTFIALGKQELGGKIPFGPYIALGALAWLFGGEQLVQWYLSFIIPQ